MADHVGAEIGFVEVSSGDELSFSAWSATADRAAAGLQAAGVAKGDRVGLYLPGTAATAWVAAYVAIHRAGAVAVPVNTRSVPAEAAGILAHAGVAALIASRGLLDVWDATAGEAPTGERGPAGALIPLIVEVGPAHGQPTTPGRTRWDELLASGTGEPVEVPVGEDDLADIVYTSGTTGRPKGVVVRYGNASLIPTGLPGWSGVGWLSCSPLFTFAGLTAIDNPMKLGMTALYLPRFDAGVWLDVVAERRPAMVFLVPAMVELLLAHPAFATADLSSIGLCAVGSAPLAPVTQRRLAEAMPAAAVSNAYGMTEAGPAYTVLPKEEAAARSGSVGRPLPPAEFFTVDDHGGRLGADQVGELVIRLPGRPREYYRDPDATASAWRTDGLHTGDLARIDADGYVYVVGRAKEVIIRGGHNVHAADVEAVLYEHPAVAEAVVAGVDHPILGEDVAAWVVLGRGGPDGASAASDIGRFAAARLSDYKVPRRITVVDHLPRNATGKVVKAELPAPAPAWAPPTAQGSMRISE
ncbi:MAG: acyl--CoA ligase [Actinomycetota bacterium]|nr:acyl--CoA ligase [Actinomycetota bacterium]